MISGSKWITIILCFSIVLTPILAACKTETIIETVEVPVEVEKPVEVEVLITPTPKPIPQGGRVVIGNYADAVTLNPILSSDFASYAVWSQLFLTLLTQNPFTGEIVGQIAESWTASEDGLTYTFKLRRDIYWTDGTPVTAKDVKFTYDALGSEFVESPRTANIEFIERIHILDDYTLEILYHALDCSKLHNLTLGILPSHMYAEDFSEIMDNPLNKKPTVTNGPFKLQDWVKDDYVILVRNEDYYLGAPNIEGLIFRKLADTTTELAVFLAGESDIISVSPEYASVIEGEIAKGRPFEMVKNFEKGYEFVGFNMANPENRENGWIDANENGIFDENEVPNLLQEPHPILGDKLVRQAIAYSLDYTNIINKVVYGQGSPIVANVLPAIEWAYHWDLEPYSYDLERAAALLDQAGWKYEGEDDVRKKDGKTLSLHIMTNTGYTPYENIATLMQDNLEDLGFDITLEILEWGTFVEKLLGQQFDMAISGWMSMGSDPDDSVFWSYRYDDPGAGFNFVSYYNQEVENLLFEAKTLPGCSTEERGDMYKRIQELIHEDVPYAFLYNKLYVDVWNTRLVGFHPSEWGWISNVQDWYLKP